MRPFKIAKKTKIYISLALVLLCNPAIATTADLSQITRLANQGDVISQTNLAEMYYEGKVVPQDYKKALEQFRRLKKVLEKDHKNDFDYYLCEINMADVF